ncbi:MAG TPA: hypothetical protein VEP49_04740 [Acidimicrobiia bacterium]|nr:hypothetical protein [Acidimicrobiia bacterium]
MSVEKHAPWGRPTTVRADVTAAGDDADLAAAVAANPGTRIAFLPSPASDFARAVGVPAMGERPAPSVDLPCDALEVECDGVAHPAVNMVVLGTAPDRQRWWSRSARVLVRVDGRVVHDGTAAAVVIANGQHLRGNDVVPRGHPGDGRIEVQVYDVPRGERAAMRARLASGQHVPHPGIRSGTGRRVEVWAAEGIRPLEVDGRALSPVTEVRVAVVPEMFTLVV